MIYVNTYIFKLIQNDEYTKKYMENNSDIFIDSNIKNVISRIRIGSINFGEYQDFLIHLLYAIDPNATNFATKDEIINGFKSFKIYLSDQELLFSIKIIFIF